jgi:hypothetical protein
MLTLRRGFQLAAAFFVLSFGALLAFGWAVAAQAPRMPDALRRYPFTYKPVAYLTHNEAIFGYGITLAIFGGARGAGCSYGD